MNKASACGDRLNAALHAGLAECGGPVVVGYSGGLDSTVLLHALANLPESRNVGLRAVHVNHGLHPDSDDWARRCHQVCQTLGISLSVVNVEVRSQGDGPESAARRARWQAFTTTLDTADVLALAQHRDDQAETVLLRLLRGAGPTGLAAMRTWSFRSNGLRVWRPWLDLSRAELAAYATSAGLDWIDDPSNVDPRYERNWLRHKVLPLLRQRHPRVDAVLTQVARRQTEALALEHHVARRILALAATPNARVLRVVPLLTEDRPQRNAALRLWLRDLGIRAPGAATLERIDTELLRSRPDAEGRIELSAHLVLRRHHDELHALPHGSDRPLRYELDWDGSQTLSIAGVGRLRLDPVPALPLPLRVRSRIGGERLRLHAQRPRHRLKLLLQEAGVPPWQRARWPVLWLEDQPAGFADVLLGIQLRERLHEAGTQLRFDPD